MDCTSKTTSHKKSVASFMDQREYIVYNYYVCLGGLFFACILLSHSSSHWVVQIWNAWLFFSVQSCWFDFAHDLIFLVTSLLSLLRELIIIPVAACIDGIGHIFVALLWCLILLFCVPNCIFSVRVVFSLYVVYIWCASDLCS